MNKTKASILTMISSLINSLLNVVISLFYNRFLILTFGSEINGLIGTLSQFVSFFSILEGGFTTAAVVALYKPLAEKDSYKISSILYTAKKYLMQVGLLIFLFSLCLGSIYIHLIDSPLLFYKTFTLLFLTCINSFLNISVLSRYTILLEADNKAFITKTFASVPKILFKTIAVILMKRTNADVLSIYLTTSFEIILNIIIILFYEKRNYKDIKFEGVYSPNSIKGTKDIFIQKVCSVIFSSTDLLLISILIGLAETSVYNLYLQVFRTVSTMLLSILTSPFNSFGLLFHTEEKTRTVKLFSVYKKMSTLLSTIIIVSLASFLVPFINLYTKDVTDIQYLDLYLVLLCYSCFFFQTTNTPYGLLINSTGLFKLQNTQSIVSTLANICVSLILAKKIGVYGIVIGSIVGYLIVLFSNVVKVYSQILWSNAKKPMIKDCLFIIADYVIGLLFIFLNYEIGYSPANYIALLIYGVAITIMFGIMYILYNVIVDRESTKESINYLINIIYKIMGMNEKKQKGNT